MKFRISESIRLTAPIHSALLEAGAIGLIVEIFLEPEETYEIEFSDERGATPTSCCFILMKSSASNPDVILQ